MTAYGVGMCPVDGDLLACVKARKSGRIVFFCPLCGTAFREPPPDWQLDEILRLDELAPAGVVLPTDAELGAAGLTDLAELDATWAEWIDEVLCQPATDGVTEEEATTALFDEYYWRWLRDERGRPVMPWSLWAFDRVEKARLAHRPGWRRVFARTRALR